MSPSPLRSRKIAVLQKSSFRTVDIRESLLSGHQWRLLRVGASDEVRMSALVDRLGSFRLVTARFDLGLDVLHFIPIRLSRICRRTDSWYWMKAEGPF